MAFQRLSPLRNLLAMFAIVVLLAACGGDPEPEETSDPDLNIETDPSGELSGKLLSTADLPPGWEELDTDAGSGDVSDQDSGFCGEPVPNEENAEGSAVVQFKKGDETTRLVESVVSYDSPEQATEAFEKVQQTVGTCKEWDLDEDGTVSRLKLSPSTFPNVADQTVAARVTSEFTVNAGSGEKPAPTEGFVTGDTVIARHQNQIVVVRHFAIGLGQQPNFVSGETEPLVRSAVQKAQQ